MKYLLTTLLLFSGLTHARDLSIDELSEYVSTRNYTVLEEAERVYQSKLSIKHARASLLPKLNIWSLLKLPGAFVDPLALGDIVQDVAPFLVPANWFKPQQTRAQSVAQEQQYLAVWSNELLTARLLFLGVYRELEVYNLVLDSLNDYKRVRTIARLRRDFSNDGGFSLNLIDERILALEDDLRSMELLIEGNKRELQFIAGIDQADLIELKVPRLVSPQDAPDLNEDDIRLKVLQAAPELKQYLALEQALASSRRAMRFSVLGSSTFSSGAGDGVFDSVPSTDGLGFGQSSAVSVLNSEIEILRLKKTASEQTIKRQLELLFKEYLLLDDSYSSASERHELSLLNRQLLESRLRYGGDISPLELIEALDNVARTRSLKLSYQVRFNEVVEKLKRMTFTAPYDIGGTINE